jgi:hypothetical protein
MDDQELLFESAMSCPECGCQFCANCFGALCDCPTAFYRHDVSHCWEPTAAEEEYMAQHHPTAMCTAEPAEKLSDFRRVGEDHG